MKNEADKQDENNPNTNEENREPSLYQVILHNDHHTPIEFVMGILEKYFYMDRRLAAEKTLEAHAKGRASCGSFSKDYAESKIAQVKELAASFDHPLNFSLEALNQVGLM